MKVARTLVAGTVVVALGAGYAASQIPFLASRIPGKESPYSAPEYALWVDGMPVAVAALLVTMLAIASCFAQEHAFNGSES